MEKIDAVKMVRKIRDEHFNATKAMSHRELLQFYREKASTMLERKHSVVVKNRWSHQKAA